MSIDRKQQVIDAASKSFSLFGYKATTMDQVAKIAKVGKGTIYTFFSHKEELFNEIMKNLIHEMKEVAEASLDPSKPFFENLHRVLYNVLDFRNSHELTIRLSHEIKEIGTPMALEGMHKLENAILSFIKKEVQTALDRREIKPCDPEITAFVMLKLYVSFISDWDKLHPRLSNQQISDLFQLYLIDGLAP